MSLLTSPEPLERGGLGGLREREGGGGGGRRRRREKEGGGGEGGRREEGVYMVTFHVPSCV